VEAKKEDRSWLFPVLDDVLSSPSWELPLSNFVDEKCDEFARGGDEVPSVSRERIHAEFKELARRLLDEHLAAVGATSADVDDALLQGRLAVMSGGSCGGTDSAAALRVLERLEANVNFAAFSQLMADRNTSINLELLTLEAAAASVVAAKEATAVAAAASAAVAEAEKLKALYRRARKIRPQFISLGKVTGKGASGVLWKGTYLKGGRGEPRVVAFKQFNQLEASKDAMKDLVREIEVASMLNHPNLQVYATCSPRSRTVLLCDRSHHTEWGCWAATLTRRRSTATVSTLASAS